MKSNRGNEYEDINFTRQRYFNEKKKIFSSHDYDIKKEKNITFGGNENLPNSKFYRREKVNFSNTENKYNEFSYHEHIKNAPLCEQIYSKKEPEHPIEALPTGPRKTLDHSNFLKDVKNENFNKIFQCNDPNCNQCQHKKAFEIHIDTKTHENPNGMYPKIHNTRAKFDEINYFKNKCSSNQKEQLDLYYNEMKINNDLHHDINGLLENEQKEKNQLKGHHKNSSSKYNPIYLHDKSSNYTETSPWAQSFTPSAYLDLDSEYRDRHYTCEPETVISTNPKESDWIAPRLSKLERQIKQIKKEMENGMSLTQSLQFVMDEKGVHDQDKQSYVTSSTEDSIQFSKNKYRSSRNCENEFSHNYDNYPCDHSENDFPNREHLYDHIFNQMNTSHRNIPQNLPKILLDSNPTSRQHTLKDQEWNVTNYKANYRNKRYI